VIERDRRWVHFELRSRREVGLGPGQGRSAFTLLVLRREYTSSRRALARRACFDKKASRDFRHNPSESGALLVLLLLLMSTAHGFWRRRRFLRVYVSPVTRELACVVALLLEGFHRWGGQWHHRHHKASSPA